MKILLLIIGVLSASISAYSQLENRLRPGQRYEQGTTVYAPRYGFRSKIPVGWEGTLPREAEIFLLMPVSAISGEVYVWGTEQDTPELLKERWLSGMEMGSGIILKAKGLIGQRGLALTAEGEMKGATNVTNRKIYAEARCSDFGVCITYISTAENSFENVKTALQAFVDNTTFDQPRNVSIYEGFDWKKFLTDKMLITYESNESAKKVNEVHFCHDGTFYSEIRRRGLMKSEAKEYQGKKKGTWSIAPGQNSTLILVFEKAPKAEIEMRIDDEKVYANGTRHFVAYSDRCTK